MFSIFNQTASKSVTLQMICGLGTLSCNESLTFSIFSFLFLLLTGPCFPDIIASVRLWNEISCQWVRMRFSQCYNVVVGCVSAVVLWTGTAVSSSRASPHQLRRRVQGRFHGEEVQAAARTRLPVHPSPPLASVAGNIRPTSHCACADLA